MEGHSESSDYFPALVSHNFTFWGVDVENLAIQVFQFKLKTNESFHQGYGLLHEEISALSRIYCVRFLLNNENEVSWKGIGLSRKIGTSSLPSP